MVIAFEPKTKRKRKYSQVKGGEAAYSDNFKHFLSGDVAVAVEVVHREGPLEFLFEFPA